MYFSLVGSTCIRDNKYLSKIKNNSTNNEINIFQTTQIRIISTAGQKLRFQRRNA